MGQNKVSISKKRGVVDLVAKLCEGAHLRKYYAWESEEEFITTMSSFDQIIWVVVESNLKKFPFEIEYFKK